MSCFPGSAQNHWESSCSFTGTEAPMPTSAINVLSLWVYPDSWKSNSKKLPSSLYENHSTIPIIVLSYLSPLLSSCPTNTYYNSFRFLPNISQWRHHQQHVRLRKKSWFIIKKIPCETQQIPYNIYIYTYIPTLLFTLDPVNIHSLKAPLIFPQKSIGIPLWISHQKALYDPIVASMTATIIQPRVGLPPPSALQATWRPPSSRLKDSSMGYDLYYS